MKVSTLRTLLIGRLPSPKKSRAALRGTTRTKRTLNLARALAGLGDNLNMLALALPNIILGYPLTSEELDAARVYFGAAIGQASMAAKIVRAKVPSSKKKLKVEGTPTKLLLDLLSAGTCKTSYVTGALWGADEITGEDNEKRIVAGLEATMDDLWALHFKLYGTAPEPSLDCFVESLPEKEPEVPAPSV